MTVANCGCFLLCVESRCDRMNLIGELNILNLYFINNRVNLGSWRKVVVLWRSTKWLHYVDRQGLRMSL